MPGTVLLLAASPAGKGRLVDAASVLPVLAAVAPSVLSGTDTANVVELADPIEPQAVLTRLRAAAAVPDPLTVFLVGQLQLDRRQRQPHLALARTTPATVRYTAFPWQWIREELRLRPPGTTTVFADLHADAESWRRLATEPLDCGPTVLLLGRVAPPPSRRAPALPGYMKALATILRSGRRPEPTVLHHDALTRAYAETSGNRGDIVLTPGGPVPSWYAPAPYSGPAPSGFHGHGPEGPLPAAAPSAVTPAQPHHGAGPLSVAAPDPDAAAVAPAAPASYGRRPGRPARDPSGPPATPLTAAPERSAPVGAPSGGAPEPSDLRGRGPGGSAARASNVRAVPSPVAPERSASGGAPSAVAPEPSDLNGRRSARPSPAVPDLRTAPPADAPPARAAHGLPPGGPTPGSSAPDPTPLAAVPARPDPHTVPLTVVPPPSDADLGAPAPYAAPPAIRPRPSARDTAPSASDAAPSAVASTPSSPYTVPAVVPAPSDGDPGASAPYAALPAIHPQSSAPFAALPTAVPEASAPDAALSAAASTPPSPDTVPAVVPVPSDPGAPAPYAALPAVVPPPSDRDPGVSAPYAALPAVVAVPSGPEPEVSDAHSALTLAVQGGRHAEAEALVVRWEQGAVREHGAGSAEALHWGEVRADIAMLAGDAGRSCEAWMAVAAARLSAGQSPDDPAVEAAVDRAHHQWGRIGDPARARELGPALAGLRERVPGRREGALRHVQERLRRLQGRLQTQP